MKKAFFIIGIFSILISCQQGNNVKNKIDNKSKESCLSCHSGLKGFSKHHDPKLIGCSSCHLGNVYSDQKDIAHQNMIKIPGNLSNAGKTCGTTACHKGELSRISNSLMSTNSGIVSIDKYAFGEVAHSDTFFHIENIGNSAADRHIKNLCFKCHLGYEKKHYAPVSQLSRGGGCLACHLEYKSGTIPDVNDNYHPSLNLNIDDGKCFGCHARSGRISTNYQGWYETLLAKDDVERKPGFRILDDGRVFAKTTEDVHHKAGLACIDCHISQEIMGDGTRYKHENNALKVQCIDCHPKNKFNTISLSEFDSISVMDYALRGYKQPSVKFIATGKDRLPLVNTAVKDSLKAFLTGKLNRKKYVLNKSSSCGKDKVHDKLACSMCHTSWAPSCIGCHTGYDPDIKLKGGHKGKWYELVDEFGISQPVMGLERFGSGYQIKPAIPGMIMTLDKNKFKEEAFHFFALRVDSPLGVRGKGLKKRKNEMRPSKEDKPGKDFQFLRWFAPVAAHTTTKNARTCESCHINSHALGFGKGELSFSIKNKQVKWHFESVYENSDQDGLPMDAWIGFLKKPEQNKTYSGHNNFYPLNLKMQKKILHIGACLKCHKESHFREKMISGDYLDMQKMCNKIENIRL